MLGAATGGDSREFGKFGGLSFAGNKMAPAWSRQLPTGQPLQDSQGRPLLIAHLCDGQ